MKLTQAELHRVLRYNPFTGTFMWRDSRNNRVHVGDIAGNIQRKRYKAICLNYQLYFAHRLAFLYMRGSIPQEIDHIDGDGLNNRWLNIRECTHSQNAANRGPTRNNKLGLKGIRRGENGKYLAQIKVNGKQIHLGTFDTSEAAARAYRHTAKQIYGSFARW